MEMYLNQTRRLYHYEKIQSRFSAEKGVHRALDNDIWRMTDQTCAHPSQSNIWDNLKISPAKWEVMLTQPRRREMEIDGGVLSTTAVIS